MDECIVACDALDARSFHPQYKPSRQHLFFNTECKLMKKKRESGGGTDGNVVYQNR